MKKAYIALGITTFLLLVFCAWAIDARDNRMEANIWKICENTVHPNTCYKGSFTDPWRYLKSL